MLPDGCCSAQREVEQRACHKERHQLQSHSDYQPNQRPQWAQAGHVDDTQNDVQIQAGHTELMQQTNQHPGKLAAAAPLGAQQQDTGQQITLEQGSAANRVKQRKDGYGSQLHM